MALRIGRYLLHDEIASGGMAKVHYGRLVGTGGFAKTVAIKRLHPQVAREPSSRDMILAEARLASRIRHPNVVPPLDVLAEGGELLLVMEYVHGEALSKLIRAARATGQLIPVAVASAILTNVLLGLHAAHEARGERGEPLEIVHRDVSPQNVIVGVDGVARVIDFGIAKAVTSREQTSTGTVKGKLPYLAPEQIEGEPLTRRTDVYAAGIVLWESLVGRRLFDGQDDGEVLRRILAWEPPAPSRSNPAVPPELDRITMRALSKRSADRFATAREMALAIEQAVTIATPSVVGSWAERLAEETLAKRASIIEALERSDTDEHPVASASPSAATDVPASPATVREGTPRAPTPMPLPPASVRPVPPASVRPVPPASVRPVPPASVRPVPPASVRPPAPNHLPERASLPPMSVPPPPTIAPLPEPARATTPTSRTPWVLFLGSAALVLLVLAAPMLVARVYIALAARHGLVLAVDRVDLSRRQVRLVGVRLTSAELPGVTLGAASVTVSGLFAPSALEIDDAVLELDGRVGDVWPRLLAFRETRGPRLRDGLASLERLHVISGRVAWRAALAEGVGLSAENVIVDVTRSGQRRLFDDASASLPLAKVVGGPAKETLAGPWLVEIERKAPLTRAVLRVDMQGSYVGRVTATATDGPGGRAATSVTFALPPVSLAELGLPPGALGASIEAGARLDVQGEITVASDKAKGRVVVGVTRATPFAGAGPVDVSVEIAVAGGAPAPVTGTLGFAPSDPLGRRAAPVARGAIEGLLDTRAALPRFTSTGTTSASPCDGGRTTALALSLELAEGDLAKTAFRLAPTVPCVPRFR